MQKYLDRKCSKSEIAQLLGYFEKAQNESTLKAVILNYFEEEAFRGHNDNVKEDQALEDIHAKLIANIKVKQSRDKHIHWYKFAAAASILVLLSFGIYYFSSTINREIAQLQQSDIKLQEKNKGAYKLGNEEASRQNYTAKSSSQQSDNKRQNTPKQLAVSESVKIDNISYNRVSIPKGGQYQLTLPDGTKVWLNAASTIAFPPAFTGNERRVKITGEVYFEVASLAFVDEKGKKEKMPFIVNVNNKAEIKVLGTHFNVNSYSDDGSIKTTLLEGSVEVKSLESNQKFVLKPGQQAAITKTGDLSIKDVNLEEVLAWKNGYFYFDNTNLQNIMQELSRWYNVKVAYEGNVPERNFSGKIQKDLKLSEVLEILKFTKVNFRIEDRCIIVTP